MAKIAIFAGHGGTDAGAVFDGHVEKDMNLAVALVATKWLRQWGYVVINNRTTDVNRSITADANLANANNVDAVVEIHQNSSSGATLGGSEVFYSVKDTGKGRALASAILRHLVALGFRDRGVKTMANADGQDMLGILRLTKAPAVLVECAFVNSEHDMSIFNAESVGLAVAEGVRDVFGASGGGGGGTGYPGTAIKLGSRGESVVQIQRCLNRAAVRFPSIPRLSEDGIFGAGTEAAVREYQRIVGLVADGVVGINTWTKLMEECNQASYPGAALRVGSRGEAVRQIQICLNRVGARFSSMPKLSEDGIFGAGTERAVREFQRIFVLSVDGIVGINTWNRLMQECSLA